MPHNHAGVILNGREADQVVAAAWVDVGGRVAQQLLEGGTATVKVALEEGPGLLAPDPGAAELTSVSGAVLRRVAQPVPQAAKHWTCMAAS